MQAISACLMNERRLVSACQVMPNSDRNIGTAPTLAATRLRGRRGPGQTAHHHPSIHASVEKPLLSARPQLQPGQDPLNLHRIRAAHVALQSPYKPSSPSQPSGRPPIPVHFATRWLCICTSECKQNASFSGQLLYSYKPTRAEPSEAEEWSSEPLARPKTSYYYLYKQGYEHLGFITGME